MILNNFVVSYFVMIVFSLGICLPAAFVALQVAGVWKRERNTSEGQHRLEKRVYLVIVLICLGFSMRLFMIPLWFLTLQSLIPSIPGAMCMAGLHQLDAPVSYAATILKFFIPLAYIYWLVLNAVDRRIETQPFMVRKLYLVMPLAILMIIESFLDAHFLSSIKPKIVSCCTLMFDLPRSAALKIIRKEAVLWMFSFYAFIGASFAAYRARSLFNKTARIVSAVSSLLALIFLVLMLHTKLSPLMLEAPFHQCVFCLFQEFPDIAIAAASVIIGLWLTFIGAIIPDATQYRLSFKFEEKLKFISVIMFCAGTAWLSVRFAVKYLFSA
ncbi:MAG: hypothetical protein WC695_01155 [Candidatus Omnitrophota bacterium]